MAGGRRGGREVGGGGADVEVGNAGLGLGRRFTSVEVGYVCVANVLLVCP